MSDMAIWKDAYNHILHGGKAQHSSWNPNCTIKLNEVGEIVFQDGSPCWLEVDEMIGEEWYLLPNGNVVEEFDNNPKLANILTKNLLTTKLWYEKGKLHRKLYTYYEEKGSLTLLSGGWYVIYDEEGELTLCFATAHNPLTIYTKTHAHAKKAIDIFKMDFMKIVKLEKALVCVNANAFGVEELKELYLSLKD